MTSRISFFKLCLENMKRRVWLLVLTILTYFISTPLVMMVAIQNEQLNALNGRKEDYREIFSTVLGMGYQSVLAAGLAIICAVAGFAWLFSKKKVDMYHSMPVRREKLFAAIYLNGILIWLVPYLVSVLICLPLIGSHLPLTGQLMSVVSITVGVNILFFFFFYNLALVAVMLTGNMINCLMTEGVLFAYAAALRGLLELYLQCFMVTYYYDFNMLEQLKFTSPMMAFIYFAEEFTKWQDDVLIYITGGAFALYLLQCLILAVIAGAVALLLYKKRPSEAAGKSIAFVKILNIYRIVLVIPLSLASGLFFAALVDGGSNGVVTAWMIFGLIFGLILSHGFIEVLFQMDIRAMFSYKKQLLATGVVVFLVAFSFKDDWYGFDRYLPEKANVESMAITAGAIEDWRMYYHDYDEDEYMSGSDYLLENMRLVDTEAAYELAKRGVTYVNDRRQAEEGMYGEEVIYYTVKYRLNSGKEVTRNYWLSEEEAYPYIEQLYTMSEFKDGSMGIFWENAAKATDVSVSDTDYDNHDLDDKWAQEFLEVYRREYESLTAEEILTSCVIGGISYKIRNENNGIIARAGKAPIYSACTESVQFLEEHGVDTSDLQENFDLEQIDEMVVRVNNTGDEEVAKICEKYGVDGYEDALFVNGKEEMEKLLPYLVRDLEPYMSYKDYDENYDVYITWVVDGESKSAYARLKKGSPMTELEMEAKLQSE